MEIGQWYDVHSRQASQIYPPVRIDDDENDAWKESIYECFVSMHAWQNNVQKKVLLLPCLLGSRFFGGEKECILNVTIL